MDPEASATQESGQEAEVTTNELFADEVEELAELTAEAESQGDESGDPAPEDNGTPEAKPTGEETPGDGKPPEEQPGEGEPPADPEKGEGEPGGEGKPDEAAGGEKPPKGYVPIQAVQEERRSRQALQRQLESMQIELEDARKGAPEKDDPFKDFKVLDDEGFAQLQEEDPDAAAAYIHKERAYDRYQMEQKHKAENLRDAERQNNATAFRAYEKIKEIVPDIATGGEGVTGLVNFAEEHGFEDASMLTLMTNPMARISVPGEDGKMKTFPMASGAVSLVNLLNTAASRKTEAQIREELRPEIIKEVTAEITGKIRNPDKPSVTSSTLKPEAGVTKNTDDYTEEEWGEMPRAERDKILAGG